MRQGLAEDVANITSLPTGIAKLGQGRARQGSAAGVAFLMTLPTGWQNWDTV